MVEKVGAEVAARCRADVSAGGSGRLFAAACDRFASTVVGLAGRGVPERASAVRARARMTRGRPTGRSSWRARSTSSRSSPAAFAAGEIPGHTWSRSPTGSRRRARHDARDRPRAGRLRPDRRPARVAGRGAADDRRVRRRRRRILRPGRHDKNTVTLSTVAGRGVLNGDLDPESTEIVATRSTPRSPPWPPRRRAGR